MVDRTGIPLACVVSAANVHDVRLMLAGLVACPIADYVAPGRILKELLADRADHSSPQAAILLWLGITPSIAERGTSPGSGLGKDR